MKLPTLVVDTREKNPWEFEGDLDFEEIEFRKLDAGDYSIKGLEHLVTVERKATCDELYQNFGSKKTKDRMYREAERLLDIPFRFMVIEQSLDDVANPDMYYVNQRGWDKRKNAERIPPAVVRTNLVNWMLDYNIHVIFAGNKGQSITKKLLIEVYDRYRKGKIDDDGSPTDR